MKRKYLLISFACILTLVIINTTEVNSKLVSPPSGSSADPFTNLSCAQSGCHAGPVQIASSTDLTLTIGTGTPTTTLDANFNYLPNTIYNIAFLINLFAPTNPYYGFQIVALDSANNKAGTMTVSNAATTKINTSVGTGTRQYMGHLNASSTKNWTFKWTSPPTLTGPVTFYYTFLTSNASTVPPTAPGGTTYKGSVTINPGISVYIDSNQTVCNGTNITLTPTVYGGVAPFSYSWSTTGSSLSCNNCQNPTSIVNQSSTYTVTVTDQNNSTASASVSYTTSGICNSCISGPSACVPTGGPVNGGFEDPSTVPCVVQGVAYSHAIQFTMFSVFNYLGTQSVDSIEFTSINNLPCGMCWAVNQADKRYTANEDGCLSITGTTTDAVGQYKLAIALKVWINGGVSGLPVPASLVDQTGIKLFLRVKTSGGSCVNVDTSINGNNLTASISCPINSFTASLGANQTVCTGANITLNPTVSGGTQPYSYSWNASGNSLSCNNCQNPTATITQNSTYTVTVTDANNNTATGSITYSVAGSNFQVSANGPLTFCQGGSVTLNAGAGYTNYHWSNNSSSSTINVSQSGTYSVTVTSSGGCTFTDSKIVTVNTPSISNYQITANGPTSFCNGGSVTLNAGSGFTSYHWNNNSSLQTITVSQTGTYLVTVVGTDGCTYTDNQSVNTNTSFSGQAVCIVSVDPISGKNVVVWEKSGGFGIDTFKVYKESSISGIYQLIRGQAFGNFSTYEDGQSNPAQKSDRYVIATVDACGESSYSGAHKTIHLTSNVGINNEVNLIWNAYEGFTYPSFNIYRGSSQSNMTTLTQVSSSTLSYTDLTPPSPPLYYQIEVINPQGCVPTAKTESYSSSLSNVVQITALGIGSLDIDDFKAISIFDENAGANILRLNSQKPINVNIKMVDYSGREVYRTDNVTQTEIILPNFISRGVYIAEVSRGQKNYHVKIFIR